MNKLVIGIGIVLVALIAKWMYTSNLVWASTTWAHRESEVAAQKIMLSLPCRPETPLPLTHEWQSFELTPGCRTYVDRTRGTVVEFRFNGERVPDWRTGHAPVFHNDVELLEARLAPHESAGTLWVKERDR